MSNYIVVDEPGKQGTNQEEVVIDINSPELPIDNEPVVQLVLEVIVKQENWLY